MHITDIRIALIAVPLSRVFRGGTYEIGARCTIITEVLTDAGVSGCTYAGDEGTGVPVTAGQSEVTNYGCQALVRGGAVDILNVDISHAGGITEWQKIAAMAEMVGVAMAHHEEPHLSQHCLGAIKFGLYPECFSEVRDPIGWHLPKHPPIVQDG
jgi:L-alanine-DL-glutamate epimerase-like enolase superfamily enzyme